MSIRVNELLRRYGGVQNNYLCDVLNEANADENSNEISILKHSPYLNNNEFISFCEQKRNDFKILSLNIQSLNAKFDELQIFLNQLVMKKCEINLICLQETWISDKSVVSLFQIEGYELVSQETICTSHGGLAFYINTKHKYKLLPIYNRSDIWEGFFVEITEPGLKKNL